MKVNCLPGFVYSLLGHLEHYACESESESSPVWLVFAWLVSSWSLWISLGVLQVFKETFRDGWCEIFYRPDRPTLYSAVAKAQPAVS